MSQCHFLLKSLYIIFSVLGTVKWLHKQRSQLVTNPGFYRLIYDVIEDYIRCGHTCIEIEEMLNRDICEQRTSEFKTLATLRHNYTIGDCAAGHRAENRDKNRNVLVVPPDDNRPYLISFQSNSTTDYINAVFVDGFCQAKAMIITEWPMQSTIGKGASINYSKLSNCCGATDIHFGYSFFEKVGCVGGS